MICFDSRVAESRSRRGPKKSRVSVPNPQKASRAGENMETTEHHPMRAQRLRAAEPHL